MVEKRATRHASPTSRGGAARPIPAIVEPSAEKPYASLTAEMSAHDIRERDHAGCRSPAKCQVREIRDPAGANNDGAIRRNTACDTPINTTGQITQPGKRSAAAGDRDGVRLRKAAFYLKVGGVDPPRVWAIDIKRP